MVDSRKKLKRKIDTVEPTVALTGSDEVVDDFTLAHPINCNGLRDLIFEYAFDPTERLQKSFTFFGISSLRKQILALAEYAGPLDQIEGYIRKAYANKEQHLQDTLIQAINLAIIGLDQTICDEKGTVLDKGMAETLLTLHAELFPQDQLKALEQAKLAAPLEMVGDKKAREERNFAQVDLLFNAFVQNDEAVLSAAIIAFNEYVKSTKPKVLTDNQYYLNLLHLVFAAFDVLARRGEALPFGQWLGKRADRFCFEIIGASLESDLPHNVRRILRNGVYYLFNDIALGARTLDVSGSLFRGDGTSYLLGVNSYYSGFFLRGQLSRVRRYAGDPGDATAAMLFQDLLRAITSASKIYYTATTGSLIEPVSDTVGIRKRRTAAAQ